MTDIRKRDAQGRIPAIAAAAARPVIDRVDPVVQHAIAVAIHEGSPP